MTNLNVGDRVEILSDAIYPNGNIAIKKTGHKSAIGKIGTITKIVDGDYIVSNLGEECGRCWRYNPDQLRKVENNEDKEETKMENNQPKDFSHVKVGQWVRFVVNDVTKYPTTTFNKWYQRLDNSHSVEYSETTNYLKYFWYKDDELDIIYSCNLQAWDLTDIRDNNPDEETKMQEDQEYYPITKDNIVEVLEHNGIDNDGYYYRIYKNYIIWNYNKDDVSEEDSKQVIIYFNNNKWLEHLELETGKLNPIPKPKFDFISYVNNNSTDKDWEKIYKLAVTIINDYKNVIKRDEHNAKIAVQMAKLAEELK